MSKGVKKRPHVQWEANNGKLLKQLIDLQDHGFSTPEIAKLFGTSKNAVGGKLHRLKSRTQIPREVSLGDGNILSTRETPGQNGGTTRAPLSHIALPPIAGAAPWNTGVSPFPSPTPQPYSRITNCAWPIGEPRTREFHFCDQPCKPGKSYCEEHAKLAYLKVRDRREDAAA